MTRHKKLCRRGFCTLVSAGFLLLLYSYRPSDELLLQTPPSMYLLHEEWSHDGAWTILPIIAR